MNILSGTQEEIAKASRIEDTDKHWLFRERLHLLQISKTGVVLDPASGQLFKCNKSALRILNLLISESNTPENISNIIANEYGLSVANSSRELLEFSQSLRVLLN